MVDYHHHRLKLSRQVSLASSGSIQPIITTYCEHLSLMKSEEVRRIETPFEKWSSELP